MTCVGPAHLFRSGGLYNVHDPYALNIQFTPFCQLGVELVKVLTS